MNMKELYNALTQQFKLQDYTEKRPDLAFVTAPKEQAVALITHLRDICNYTHLVMFTCVDWIEQDLYQLTYLLHNYTTKTDLGIKVFISRQNPVMDSIHHLWAHGKVYQRELHEMFGLVFPGSPDMERSFVLEGWQGPPPMQRDFDTAKYCAENFDNRPRTDIQPEQYMKEKLYPED